MLDGLYGRDLSALVAVTAGRETSALNGPEQRDKKIFVFLPLQLEFLAY